ncbi:MAG: efflux RND transporter periplasmic adaptor subunit, partial [Planctomycetota bacterium]
MSERRDDSSHSWFVPPKRFLVAVTKRLSPGWCCAAVVVAALAIWLLWDSGQPGGAEADTIAAAGATTAGEPTMWTCSMHPQIRSPKPGKCPICGMDLIPVTQSAAGMRTVTLMPEAVALMQLAVAPVERRYVTHTIPMVGKVDFDETRLGYITAWVAGRLDRLYVDFTGVTVRKGDHMAYIYSEQLYAAQQELIEAVRSARRRRNQGTSDLLQSSGIDLVEAAREKLRLLGLTPEQIAEIEKRDKPSDHVTIYAPVSGIVIEKLKQEGERVAVGDRIYTIADLSQVWVHLDAYESDLPWVRYGQDVTITTEAYPGEEFHGRIAFIQPVLDDRTRTVKVRVNVPNETGKLKPGMFVHATIHPTVAAGGRVMDPSLAGKWISPMHPEIIKDEPGVCDICGMPLVRAESLGYVSPSTDTQPPPLVIPHLAPLITGKRAVVYVQLPELPDGLQNAVQETETAVAAGDLAAGRERMAALARLLDRPYRKGTSFARALWSRYADALSAAAVAGARAKTPDELRDAWQRIDDLMVEVNERFAPPGQPTYEGREIVLGPRAGDYYLVRHGLEEGELVVTRGNFKLDAEIQIQAKPSMMTPEGGGTGGGHGAHGGHAAHGEHGGHGGGHADQTAAAASGVPAAFAQSLHRIQRLYHRIAEAVLRGEDEAAREGFADLQQAIASAPAAALRGHPRAMWKELAMLMTNDAVLGRDAKTDRDLQDAFAALRSHVRRLQQAFGVQPLSTPHVHRIGVGTAFQKQLSDLWRAYLQLQRALAADDAKAARQAVALLRTSVESVDASVESEDAQKAWARESANLQKLVA